MAMTVISVKSSVGEYQGVKYDNVLVYAMNPDSTNPKVLAGCEVEQLKIKTPEFNAMLYRNIGALNNPEIKEVKDIIGLMISPTYGKFGVVSDFTLAVPEKKSR